MRKFSNPKDRKEEVEEGKSYKGSSSKSKKYNKYNNKNGKTRDEGSRVSYAAEPSVDAVHTNDISWWNKANPLFVDATRVPFNRIVGDPIVTTNTGITGVTETADFRSAPGIMRFDYLPSVGYANNSNDPVNRSFTSIYGDIYSRTTGAMQFTQSDLALFVLGVSSIIQMIGAMKRALGVCQLYASKNYYYPKHLLIACGFDPADIIPKQDEYRRRLNQQIQSINALRVPNFIDLFKRHYTLASNIWLDEDSPDAQMFVFTPQYYYAYSDVNSRLDATPTALVNSLGSSWLNKIDAAIALWRNSADLGLISGSIQRAYKDTSLLSLDMVTLDSVVIPVYDKVMLGQINNAVILPTVSNFNITQDVVANITKFEPYMSGANLGALGCYMYGRKELILNAADGDTSPENIMEMTRLATMATYDGVDMDLINCGTELLTGCSVYVTYRATPTSVPALDIVSIPGSFQTIIETSASGLRDFVEQLSIASMFRNGPRFEFCTHTGASSPFVVTNRYRSGDLYKYTTLDTTAYAGLQSAALQSIYVVSEVTKPNNYTK